MFVKAVLRRNLNEMRTGEKPEASQMLRPDDNTVTFSQGIYKRQKPALEIRIVQYIGVDPGDRDIILSDKPGYLLSQALASERLNAVEIVLRMEQGVSQRLAEQGSVRMTVAVRAAMAQDCLPFAVTITGKADRFSAAQRVDKDAQRGRLRPQVSGRYQVYDLTYVRHKILIYVTDFGIGQHSRVCFVLRR
jgi:hypothetical protein